MSKELTPLEAFNNIKCNCNQNYPDFEKNKNIVETALKENVNLKNSNNKYRATNKKLRKKGQVLRIIKEKNVNVRAFKKTLLMKQNDDVKLRAYNSQNHRDEDDLTQEEFDLLKEVLNNENS